MWSSCALGWLVCAGVAWRAAGGGSAMRGSPLVPEGDWLSRYTGERRPLSAAKSSLDCFSQERAAPRPYPSACYGHAAAFEGDAFWQFWQEARGDLQYTFDFVLYDEFFEAGGRERGATSLWLLVAYLKHLAVRIPDPDDVAVGSLAADERKIYEKYKTELMDLNKEFQKKVTELEDLVRSLK